MKDQIKAVIIIKKDCDAFHAIIDADGCRRYETGSHNMQSQAICEALTAANKLGWQVKDLNLSLVLSELSGGDRA